jgi:hypothetical protein
MLTENQAAKYSNLKESINTEVYMFKVLTMTNAVVREEFSFIFRVRIAKKSDSGVAEENPYQRLQLSRDLNKLMEVFGDSKCNIFTKQKDSHKK